MRGLVTAGRSVGLVSGSAGLIIERAPGLPGLPEAGIAHSALAGHSQTLPPPPVRVRTFCPPASFVLAGSSRRVGGVHMQRPQRRVSAARTNDVDTDERRERIIDEGAGGLFGLVEDGQGPAPARSSRAMAVLATTVRFPRASKWAQRWCRRRLAC